MEWSTDNADSNELPVSPGVYEHRHWDFTWPGTYVFQVHVKGHPKGGRLVPEEANVTTVTSEVVTYTFHVGPLTLDEQPVFQVERSVAENSAADAPVGPPVKVVGIAGDALDYTLAGDGSDNFAVKAAAGAQIVVAPGAALDFREAEDGVAYAGGGVEYALYQPGGGSEYQYG